MQKQDIQAAVLFGVEVMKIDRSFFMWKYIKDLWDENSVEDFLAKNDINLPKSLVNKLKKYNGGRPRPNTFNLKNGQEKVFQSLLSYNKDDLVNIYEIYPLFIESNLYPIGIDPAGNFICVEKENTSNFIWLNHETAKQEPISTIDFL